jgi:hypothetical protein
MLAYDGNHHEVRLPPSHGFVLREVKLIQLSTAAPHLHLYPSRWPEPIQIRRQQPVCVLTDLDVTHLTRLLQPGSRVDSVTQAGPLCTKRRCVCIVLEDTVTSYAKTVKAQPFQRNRHVRNC